MKRLLRSVIDVDGGIEQDHLCRNFTLLSGANIKFGRPEDQKIFEYVKAYFQNSLEMPARQTILDYYEKVNDISVIERIADIAAAPSYIRTNYKNLLEELTADQENLRFVAALDEAKMAVRMPNGYEDKQRKVTIKGRREALNHIISIANEIEVSTGAEVEVGDIRREGSKVLADMHAAEEQGGAVGVLTGINGIDKHLKGLRRGNLWVHAAYTGELKTSFCATWIYNAVTRYRQNVFYASLEMTRKEMRDKLHVMHSAHLRWRGRKPIKYSEYLEGGMSKEDKEFFAIVCEDFETNDEYGSMQVYVPHQDVTIAEIKLQAELVNKQYLLDMIVVDHALLVSPTTRHRDYGVQMNEIIRDAKKMALHFDGGRQIGVVLPFQVNREGKKDAMKADGLYDGLKILSYANEAERSADVVTTTYLDQGLRDTNRTRFQCLKTRNIKAFPTFEAGVDFEVAARICNYVPDFRSSPGIGVEDGRATAKSLFDL